MELTDWGVYAETCRQLGATRLFGINATFLREDPEHSFFSEE